MSDSYFRVKKWRALNKTQHVLKCNNAEKSFKKKEVESSESESRNDDHNNHRATISSASVTRILAQPKPMINMREDEASNGQANIPSLSIYNDVALHLEGVIQKEMEKTRRSINYAITERFKEMLKTLQYTHNPSNQDQAWKTIGDGLPFGEIQEFINFEIDLKNNEDKQNALLEIFKMVTAGSSKLEDDVAAIMGKIIKKDVQLLYSGCGKKIKCVGKKSFKETETFKVMEQFLLAKHVNAGDKAPIVTLVSRFLSGAKDREGGRTQRIDTHSIHNVV